LNSSKKSRDFFKAEKGVSSMTPSDTTRTPNFIRAIIEEDLKTNKHGSRVRTRFPPEPNGYLHIGHAKSICLNFGLARDYGGLCNLRFDDTNPSKEEREYVESIKKDVRWLGFDWDDREFYASDYFNKLHDYALLLIRKGKAYVDDLSADEIREYRGTLTRPGRESPYRNRSVEENLDLFERMRRGEFEDGARVLRAKIDMAAPNLNMRDPVMYRILHAHHHRSGDAWCIYPTYDFAHGQSDSIEGITHSICTLEFEDHRPLYDWFIEELGIYHSQQIEFARLNLGYTIMSKRMLLELVDGRYVAGWDDPRMPTISGLRRRGYTPESIRDFCERIGVAKKESMVDSALLEHCLREDLNKRAPRVMAVLRPLKVLLINYPEDKVEELDAVNNPEDPSAGTRTVPFSRVLYIEQEDFQENPLKKFFRLAPGREVRLRYAYFIRCVDVIKDQKTGEIRELHCTYDPETRGGDSPDGRKVGATLHWVSAAHSLQAEVRLYDQLFTVQNPTIDESVNFKTYLNPDSLETLTGCRVEPGLKAAASGSRYQFERLGYFCVDPGDSSPERLVFNRTVTLRDTWAKIQKEEGGSSKKAHEKPKGQETLPAGRQAIEPISEEITIGDFSKIDLRVGIIREASVLEGAKKLLRLMVDIGEGRHRQIFAGISSAYPEPGKLIGKKVVVAANLKPRKMSFGISEGMVLSGGNKERLSITTFDGDPLPGDKVS
jgi:glutaminyl-tRNA synthetase